MKSVLVKTKIQSLQSLVNRNPATQTFTNHRQTSHRKQTQNIAPPPTDETINYLNKLGQQYPFCVNFKPKHHDPL
jgi:hypothetical protein